MQEKIDAKDFGKVAVLLGGTSSEREISLLSGKEVLNALLRQGVDSYAIDVGENIINDLLTTNPNRAFIALHGNPGEDGVIQGVLDTLKIPYASSGFAASALTIDKIKTNLVLQSYGLPVLPFIIVNTKQTLAELLAKFNLPLCIKPADSGSSCGVTRVNSPDQLPGAYEEAKKYSSNVMMEPWIVGREFTVGILGDLTLPVLEIVTPDGFYDYEAKYLKDNTGYICPCDLSFEEQKQLQDIALRAFALTGCRCWGRVDFLQDDEGKFWLLEINTIPGLTTHSLVPKAAKNIGIDYDQLILRILNFTF